MQLSFKNYILPWKPLLLIAPFFFWGTAMVAMKGVIPHTTPIFPGRSTFITCGNSGVNCCRYI